MTRTPPYLQPGNTIGIVCPAGYMTRERMDSCISVLTEWGYNVRLGATVSSVSGNYFSGADEERLNDLQAMLNDPGVHAVLCARGGYGLTRIIDAISFKKFREHPKWIIGFSDITLLHLHVYANFRISTIHGPMAAAFSGAEAQDAWIASLKNILEGKKSSYHCAPHPFNKKGEAVGELVGGNLSLMAHSIGTASGIKTKGRILFLEDVGEYLYNTDRMLRQLKRAGKFDQLAGLVLGSFTGMKDTERPFGMTVEELILDVIREYDFPVCFHFPAGHGSENAALKLGAGYKFKVSKNKVSLSE